MALHRQNGDDEITDQNKRRRRSTAWKYFEVKSSKHKVAVCNLCNTYHSYKSTVSNLLKHLRRMHNVGYPKDDTEDETSKTENGNDEDTTDTDTPNKKKIDTGLVRCNVWMYFKKYDIIDKIAECLLCQRRLSYKTTVTNLKKHLVRKHLNVDFDENDDKKIIFSNDGQIYELQTNKSEQEDPIEMDEVYLDDFNEHLEEQSEEKIHKNSFKILEKNKRKKRKLSKMKTPESSDEEESSIHHTYNSNRDPLEHFGKYVAALLAKLPKNVSNRLQVSFIQQLMDAQMERETPKSSKNNIKKSFSVNEQLLNIVSLDEESTVPNVTEATKITIDPDESEIQTDNE